MQPLQFEPIVKRALWGGRRLATVLGKRLGEHADYSESWEIADCGDAQTHVADGPFRGWTLARLVAEQHDALLGSGSRYIQFPLLIKFLDANDRLSIQVHPNDEQAQRGGLGPFGKTEAWIILDALPGSRIYAGLRPHIDRPTLERHLDAGTIEECLHTFPATPGDAIFVAAGTLHAISGGILLAEIQQSSDLTFRLFDWNRLGPDGNPRSVNRQAALQCIDFNRGPVNPGVPRIVADSPNRVEELVRCEYFVVNRHTVSASLVLPADDRFRILLCLAGSADVLSTDFHRRLRKGDTLLIPASAAGASVSANELATLLEVHLP